MAIQPTYTPFMTPIGEKIGQGLMMRSQNRMKQESNRLAGDAMMGDQDALQELYMYSPQMASQIQQRNEQRALAAQQQSMAQKKALMERRLGFQKEFTSMLPQLAKMNTVEEAQAFAQQRLGPYGEIYDVKTLITDKITPEFFESNKLAYQAEPKDDKFIEKEWGYAKEAVTKLKKRAADVDSSYNKIQGLMKTIQDPKAKAGTKRIAIASAITNLARILSPGIVTDRDFANLTGGSTSIGSVLSYFKDKDATLGQSLEQYAKNLDPTNPELFDPTGFLQVATESVGAEAPNILLQLEEAKDRAKSAGFSDRAMKTNFGNLKSIEGLSRFVTKPKPVINPKDPNLTVDQIIEIGKKKVGGQ